MNWEIKCDWGFWGHCEPAVGSMVDQRAKPMEN